MDMDAIGGDERSAMTKYLTVKEVRELLGVASDDTIRGLIHAGEVKAFKAGKAGKTSKWLIDKESVNEYIERSTMQVLGGVEP